MNLLCSVKAFFGFNRVFFELKNDECELARLFLDRNNGTVTPKISVSYLIKWGQTSIKPVKLFHTLPKQKLAILIIYSNDAYALTCEYNSPENIFQILHGTVSSKPCHKKSKASQVTSIV